MNRGGMRLVVLLATVFVAGLAFRGFAPETSVRATDDLFAATPQVDSHGPLPEAPGIGPLVPAAPGSKLAAFIGDRQPQPPDPALVVPTITAEMAEDLEGKARAGDPSAAYAFAQLLIACAGNEASMDEAGETASCDGLPAQPGQEATDWLSLAAENGNAAAQYELATLQLVDEARQQAYLETSAIQNHVLAQLALAQRYDNGDQATLVEAYSWYRRAADNGSEAARLRAGELEDAMPRDVYEEALRRFEQVAGKQ